MSNSANEWSLSPAQQAAHKDFTREQIVELVRKWGGSTTDAALDPRMLSFTVPHVSGFISYRLACGCAIVFGDPICAPSDQSALTQAFHRSMQELGKRVIYIAASPIFADWASPQECKCLIEFGQELILDPSRDPSKNTGTYGSLVRRKVKAALRDEVKIQEYLDTGDTALEQEIEQVGDQWLASRRGPQVHISDVYLFQDRVGKRWFYATKGESIVGVLCLNRLEEQQGWLLNHLMITLDAPTGTSELLITTVLDILNQEGCRYVTVGMVTIGQLGKIVGLSPLFEWLARKLFKLVSKVTRIDGLNTFWGKFQPTGRPSYLLFSEKTIGLKELFALKQALSS